MLQEIPVLFQWSPISHGYSMQHACDMSGLSPKGPVNPRRGSMSPPGTGDLGTSWETSVALSQSTAGVSLISGSDDRQARGPPLPAALDRRRDGRLLHHQRPQRAGARLRLFRGGAGARQRYRLLGRRVGLGIDRGMCGGGGPKQQRESQNPRQTDEKGKGESQPHLNTLNERHEFAYTAQQETPLPSSGSQLPIAGTDSIESPAETSTGGQSAYPSP